MFCPHCGNEIADDAVICVKCGREVGKSKKGSSDGEKWGTGAFVGLILMTLFVPYVGGLLGLIFGIIGLTKPAKKKQGLTLVIIAVVGFILSVVMWGAIFALFLADSYDPYGLANSVMLNIT
jgi:uncharacterized membrane protein YvbJ